MKMTIEMDRIIARAVGLEHFVDEDAGHTEIGVLLGVPENGPYETDGKMDFDRWENDIIREYYPLTKTGWKSAYREVRTQIHAVGDVCIDRGKNLCGVNRGQLI